MAMYQTRFQLEKARRDAAIYREFIEMTADGSSVTVVRRKLADKYKLNEITIWSICKRMETKS